MRGGNLFCGTSETLTVFAVTWADGGSRGPGSASAPEI
jgi:hypothetical protein